MPNSSQTSSINGFPCISLKKKSHNQNHRWFAEVSLLNIDLFDKPTFNPQPFAVFCSLTNITCDFRSSSAFIAPLEGFTQSQIQKLRCTTISKWRSIVHTPSRLPMGSPEEPATDQIKRSSQDLTRVMAEKRGIGSGQSVSGIYQYKSLYHTSSTVLQITLQHYIKGKFQCPFTVSCINQTTGG